MLVWPIFIVRPLPNAAPNGTLSEQAAVNPRDRQHAAGFAGDDGFAQHVRPVETELQGRLDEVQDVIDGPAVRLQADAVDAVRPARARRSFRSGLR